MFLRYTKNKLKQMQGNWKEIFFKRLLPGVSSLKRPKLQRDIGLADLKVKEEKNNPK